MSNALFERKRQGRFLGAEGLKIETTSEEVAQEVRPVLYSGDLHPFRRE